VKPQDVESEMAMARCGDDARRAQDISVEAATQSLRKSASGRSPSGAGRAARWSRQLDGRRHRGSTGSTSKATGDRAGAPPAPST